MAQINKMGWLRDWPDHRDYSVNHSNIACDLSKISQILRPISTGTALTVLPDTVDLRAWCSPVENQGRIGSCTANAAAGLVEYWERKTQNKYINVSRLFIYKNSRKLLHMAGDSGAYLRGTMAALKLFGACPEAWFPYTDDLTEFDKDPDIFCYSLAQNYQSIKYYRLDPSDTTPQQLLNNIKRGLAKAIPAMFGFTVYQSMWSVGADGLIPYPTQNESVVGGHAVLCVGYDDARQALLVKNSWGESWGMQGYGWLPCDYVLNGLAVDWWSLIKSEWVDLEIFGL